MTGAWTWFGRPGHFIDAAPRFHLHTHVGDKCVSTVGDFPGASPTSYETRVFRIGSHNDPSKWEESDIRHYDSAADAEQGHIRLVRLCHLSVDSFTDEVTQS